MRKTLLSLAAVAAIASAATLASTRADAMSVGAAAAIQNAIADTSVVQDVAYVCRHRYYSSRRVCAFVPGRPVYRPYRGYGFRGGYRGRRY